jgi:hypothetical protein
MESGSLERAPSPHKAPGVEDSPKQRDEDLRRYCDAKGREKGLPTAGFPEPVDRAEENGALLALSWIRFAPTMADRPPGRRGTAASGLGSR